MKSIHGFDYKVKSVEIEGISLVTLNDLDESIDTLCAYFGEEEQDNSLAEQFCPYFGVLWESSVGLAQHLRKLDLVNKKVLEIGCGLAFPSFVASRQGASVLATDFHEDVPLFLEVNQKQNQIFFPYKKLNWRGVVEKLEEAEDKYDLVIGSDILYENQHPQLVAQALLAFLKPGGRVILADPGRAYLQKFISSMNECGFREKMYTEIVSAEYSPKNKVREIYIFEYES